MTALVLLLAAAAAASWVDRDVPAALRPDFEGISFDENINLGDPMKLHLMTDEVANGAMCLDGTPAGFYFSPAADAANANNWEIYFQGGGWCYDAMDCYGRSSTGLGSSTHWANTSSMGGIMSDDPTVNPDFAKFNRVHMAYCDGNSFSGDRTEPLVVNGKKLWFRGRRIIDATFRTLMKSYGLGKAENILLTGCSAGGLATYLHTQYVGDLVTKTIPSLKKFKAASISGFFLLHNTVANQPVYPTEMKEIFGIANSTNGLNAGCIASKQPEDQWMCNFAQEAYAHITYPIFPLNSALDSWQTGCIYTSELVAGFPNQTSTANGDCGAVPGWADCSHDPENCNQNQIGAMNQYMTDFMTIMNSTTTYNKDGNGAFVHSCHTHCEAQSGSYNSFKVNGVSMQQAVSAWWNADNEPASKHSYSACLYKDGPSGPRKCNPTC